MSGNKHKSSDVGGTAEERKSFMMQEVVRAFSLCEEVLLVFEAEDPNVEPYTKVEATIQNAIQCYCVI